MNIYMEARRMGSVILAEGEHRCIKGNSFVAKYCRFDRTCHDRTCKSSRARLLRQSRPRAWIMHEVVPQHQLDQRVSLLMICSSARGQQPNSRHSDHDYGYLAAAQSCDPTAA